MSGTWNLGTLLHGLAERDQHPAVIAFNESGLTIWTSRRLADETAALARHLQEFSGLRSGSVAIWAPNSPEWIAVALGVLASGSILVPIDDLADLTQFGAALQSSGARVLFTTSRSSRSRQTSDRGQRRSLVPS